MKKIFMTFSAVATLSAAIVLTSCNNAEQVKKQVDEQNSKIQSAVDEKLNGLNEEVNAACAAKVDSLASVAFTTWQADWAKAHKGKKPVVKPKPKEEVKKEEPKKPETKADKMGGNTGTTNTPEDKASKMGGNTNTTNTPNDKASKMGGNNPH
jgi:hypothetical protein